jgi:hypothetical protein
MAWRDTALQTKVLGMDGQALFPFVIWLFHWSWTTFYISLAGMGVFAIMMFFKISLLAVIKAIPRLITSNKRIPVQILRYSRRNYRN